MYFSEVKQDRWQKRGKSVFSVGNILQTGWKLNAYYFSSPAVLLKPCLMLIKVSAVSIKLVPVAWFLLREDPER